MSTDPAQYVTSITPSDVLFGRGSGPNDHEGNVKFREIVSQRKGEYMATNHRQTKAKIAKEIVDTVLNNNGRFLKKLEPSEIQKLGFDTEHDLYTIVDDDTIMEKAKQALRQNRDKVSRQGSVSPKPRRDVSHPMPLGGGAQLPPNYGIGNNGHYQMANQAMAPGNVFSGEPAVYQEDAHGYATYTTTLDDPEDQRFFGARRMSSGSRRGSLLGGRRDGGPRQNSMQMTDVWKKDNGSALQSMQMSELMESFKGMSTTGELNSSEDTIGTIEGDLIGKSQMSMMSVVSIASSTSLFKSSSSDKIATPNNNEDTFPVPSPDHPISWNNNNIMMTPRNAEMPPPEAMSQRTSINSAFTSGSISHLLQGTLDGSSLGFNFDTSSTGILGSASKSPAANQGHGSSPDRVLPTRREEEEQS